MENPPSERSNRRSPALWVFIAVLVFLNLCYDYYHPRGIVLDIVIGLVLLVRYLSKSE